MKKSLFILTLIVPLIFTSCIVVDSTPGPHGRSGNAYFGIDYDNRPPYSYWDNNNSIPYNPILGEYYRTSPGIYEFEYFINPHEYYYGTYEVWTNQGGHGGAHGEPGFDGVDTYLLLITDPGGFYQHTNGYRIDKSEPVIIEKKLGESNYKITIQKGNVNSRKTHDPKFLGK